MIKNLLRLEAYLPDGFHTLAEVVEDMTALTAASSGKEIGYKSRDVMADIEIFRIIDTDTLNMQTETANARENNSLAIT